MKPNNVYVAGQARRATMAWFAGSRTPYVRLGKSAKAPSFELGAQWLFICRTQKLLRSLIVAVSPMPTT